MGGVTVQALQARLLADVLPAKAQALLADGMQLGHVAALYPMPAAAVEDALVARLRAAAGFTTRQQVLAFLQHAATVWTASDLVRAKMATTFGLDANLVFEMLHMEGVRAAVGSYSSDTFNGTYRCLGRTIELLGWWVAAGDTGFSAQQTAMLAAAVTFWFEVLDFNGVADRV